MASEESRFVARAERLAGPTGVVGFQAAAAREAAFAPQNRYVLPQFEEKTPYGFKRQDPYTRLFEDRIIFMGVQVDDTSADDIMAQLLVLESQDPNRDVMMYINSPGGSMTAMTAIYDTMQYIKPDVQTVCLGQAASAAAITEFPTAPPAAKMTSVPLLYQDAAWFWASGVASKPPV